MPYPYIDLVLNELPKVDSSLSKSFGHHLHWGYWEDPDEAISGDDSDFFLAAENLTSKLCTLAKITNETQVLDVGCGLGGTVSYLNDHFNKMKLTGLNIDNRQIMVARERITAKNNNTVEFIEGDACDLPFKKQTFDRILALECIFHFPSREQFFREAVRTLKPGGSITLCDFVASPLILPYCKMMLLPGFKRLNFFGHCNVTTLKNYRRLALKFNLKIKIHDVTINTIPTYDYLNQLVKKMNLGVFYNMSSRPGIAMMRFLSNYRLLTYPIISFVKPE